MFSCACWTAESKDGDGEEAPTLTAARDSPVKLSETSAPSPETKSPQTGEAGKISQALDKAEEASESKDKEDSKAPSQESRAQSKESIGESSRASSKESTAASGKPKKASKRKKRASVKIAANGEVQIDQSAEEFEIGEQLVRSAEAADLGTIRSLLEQRADVETMDREGRSVLRTAAKYGHVDVCRVLLVDFGADINGRNPYNGYTSLHWACKFDREETIKLFVSYGASSVQDKDGLLPLDLVQKRNPKIADWMTSTAASPAMGA